MKPTTKKPTTSNYKRKNAMRQKKRVYKSLKKIFCDLYFVIADRTILKDKVYEL